MGISLFFVRPYNFLVIDMDGFMNYLACLVSLLWGYFESQPISYQIAVCLIAIYLLVKLLVWIVKVAGLRLYAYGLKKKDIHLLKNEISAIKVQYVHDHNFSFVVKDLVNSPIEDRDTFFEGNPEKKAFVEGQIKELRRRYENIKKEIEREAIPDSVLSVKDIDYILNKVFNAERIFEAIERLNKKRKENDSSIAFIGNKLGLYSYSYENEHLFSKTELVWECYRTDHFTWLVFKELCSDRLIPKGENLSPHSFFNDLCKRLNKYQKNDKYRSVLMHTLSYIFSSLGIDALVVGKDCRNRLVSLASIRSASIDRSHKSRIHVSVDESFSDTDMTQEEDYSVERWLKRGIEEEIGISLDNLKDIKITYTDFSIVFGNYGEIGLSAIVESDDLDEWLMYPGKDKALESAGMFLMKVPGLFSLLKIILLSPQKGLQMYVGRSVDSSYSKFPWVEFAVPIYIRTYLRKLTLPIRWSTAVLISSVVPFLYSLVFEDKAWSLGAIFSLLGLLLVFAEFTFKRKYFLFSSWCPLWNGNVKTLQLTGRILKEKEGNVNNGLYMMAEKPLNIALKNMRIMEPPLSSIRKSYNHDEQPISFYRVASKDGGKKLRFFTVYYKSLNPRLLYYYAIRRKKNNQGEFSVDTYSFNFGMRDDVMFDFHKTLDELSQDDVRSRGINVNSLKCYFKLHGLCLDEYRYCNSIPEDIYSNYQLCDLYEYKDSYYWSAFHKKAFPKEACERKHIAKVILEDFYSEPFDELKPMDTCVKRERNATSVASYQCINSSGETIQIDFFCLEDSRQGVFQKKVNSLLKRSLERFGGKMNELETIALQYMLVRDDVYVADIRYNKFRFLYSWFLKRKVDRISSLSGLIFAES